MQRTHIEFVCVHKLFPQQQGQSAALEEGALTQILSTEPLQRENFSSFLCLLLPPAVPSLFCLYGSHPLLSILPSGTLYYFIFLESLQSSPNSASFFALLVFGTDLTTALQCRGRCINTLPFFLPSYLHGV